MADECCSLTANLPANLQICRTQPEPGSEGSGSSHWWVRFGSSSKCFTTWVLVRFAFGSIPISNWNSTSGFDFDQSPQSTCHSAPVCEILSKSDHPRQKKMTSCQFPRWRISAILDFRDPIKKPNYITSYRSSIDTIALNCLVFQKSRFAFWRQHPRWRISAIWDFRGPIMGSLKSPCTTSYRSSIETIALNCSVYFWRKFFFFAFWPQTDGQHRSTKPLSLSRAAA